MYKYYVEFNDLLSCVIFLCYNLNSFNHYSRGEIHMKKTMIAILAVALILTMLCGQALAASGDITTKSVKAYADAAMTKYVGTIPAYTALVVRSHDTFADVYVNGKIVYISDSALLNKDASSKYVATLNKGTKVYQRATTSANDYTLQDSGTVKVCKVSGDWALVQSTGSKGLYAFVKVNKLTNIRVK